MSDRIEQEAARNGVGARFVGDAEAVGAAVRPRCEVGAPGDVAMQSSSSTTVGCSSCDRGCWLCDQSIADPPVDSTVRFTVEFPWRLVDEAVADGRVTLRETDKATQVAPRMSAEDRKILVVFVDTCDEISSVSSPSIDLVLISHLNSLVNAIEAGLADLDGKASLSADHRLKLESYAPSHDADPTVALAISRILLLISHRSISASR